MNYFLLVLLSALCTYFAMPNPFTSFAPLVFVCLVPFFMVMDHANTRMRLILSFLYIVLLAVFFLIPASGSFFGWQLWPFVAMIIVFSATAAVYSFSLTLAFNCGMLLISRSFIVSAAWITAQFIVSFVPVALPFQIESALYPLPFMINGAAIAGPYFVAFVIIIVNCWIFEYFKSKSKYCLVCCVLMLLLLLLPNLYVQKAAESVLVKVALIQTNYSVQEYGALFSNRFLGNHTRKKAVFCSRLAQKENPGIIVWPEMVSDSLCDRKASVSYLKESLCSSGADLISGTLRRDPSGNLFNSILLLRGDGTVSPPYNKMKVFPLFETGCYKSGKEFVTLISSTALNPLGAMICLESLYPWISRGFTEKGAKVLFVLASDTAFGNSSIPYIHKAIAALRAVENNRYVVHLNNSGPSAVFDNRGREILTIPYGKTAYGIAGVLPINERSFYSKHGDWFAVGCALFFAYNVVGGLRRRSKGDAI